MTIAVLPARPRLLFVELWRLGDAVAATAGLRALRLAFPDAAIGVVAHSFHGDPLFRSPDADVRLAFNAFWTRGKVFRDKYLPWTIDYKALAHVARAVRTFQPDHILLFRGDVREQVFFSALAPGRVTDLDGPHSVMPVIPKFSRPQGVPRWKEYVSHVRQWSGKEVSAKPALANVKRDGANRKYLLIHPGASWRFKQWSAVKIASLVGRLQGIGHDVRVVAGPEDRQIAREIEACIAELKVEFPSLEQLYSLVAGAQAVVCNNSAALHIAEALGTPCVALTGPSDPVKWGTYHEHSRTLQRSAGLPCHPCRERRCVRPSRPCIEDIYLNDVIQTLIEMEITSPELRVGL